MVHTSRASKRAFTLIELLVVIGIIGVTATFGLTSFFRSQERLKVENAGKELVIYLRGVQNRARAGDRGVGGCNDPEEILARANTFLGWETRITDTAGEILFSRAACDDVSGVNSSSRDRGFELSNGLTFSSSPVIDTIFFESLFGNIKRNRNPGSPLLEETRFWITSSQTEYEYYFIIDRGTITNGCLCEGVGCASLATAPRC